MTTRKTYDIEADWIMMSGCNYRCQYCFWPADDLGARPALPAEKDALVDFFDGTGLTWQLHMTGGEPFLYRDYTELVQALTRKHTVSVNSNLSSERVVHFAETVDPARVPFMNCGFHVTQREMRGRVDDFVRRVKVLRSAGFNVFVTYVMYPPLFERLPQDFAALADAGVPLIPKAFRGTWEGKGYPEAYTEEERKLFLDLSTQARRAYDDVWSAMGEAPTIDPFLDRDLIENGVPDFRGKLCRAGRDFARIREDGTIQSCGPHDVIGSLVDGTFQRREGPSPCREVECPYFCYKYLVNPADAVHGPAAERAAALAAASAPGAASSGLLPRLRSFAGRLAGR